MTKEDQEPGRLPDRPSSFVIGGSLVGHSSLSLTPAEAVERLNTILAHAWMVRTFLKHADEVQEDEGMLDVPRTLYDGIRAVEPAYQRGDHADYLRRLKGKLPKFRRAADHFAAHFREFSPHTNFEMASLSLLGVVRQMEEVFAAVSTGPKGGHADDADRTADPRGSEESMD